VKACAARLALAIESVAPQITRVRRFKYINEESNGVQNRAKEDTAILWREFRTLIRVFPLVFDKANNQKHSARAANRARRVDALLRVS
jgi:hypothetical protein